MNTYRVLTEPLRPIADGAIKYFGKEFGLNGHKIEAEVHPQLEYRPTLHWLAPDKYVICGEVCDVLFPIDLDRAILSCRNHGIPAKLFVIVPAGLFDSVPTKSISFARENGIGILEVDEKGTGKMLSGQPISLSLTGLRSFDVSEFPARYRAVVKAAIETFKLGNPPEACAIVYKELENLTRRIAKKAQRIAGGVTRPCPLNIDTDSWHSIITYLNTHVVRAALSCPELKAPLFNRLLGVTEHRNDTGHKPSSMAKLIARDQELRNRFESAVDILKALVHASSPMKP
jgi:hypothetical protein